MADTPNPGSDEAGDQGCTCAVLDNNHGKSAPWPPDGWWITEGCPLHAPIIGPAHMDTIGQPCRGNGECTC